MYVIPTKRDQDYASSVLKELERWCVELGVKKYSLETGVKQPEAIQLYHKND
jgi:GNAT superfamily N-acetyltransferase